MFQQLKLGVALLLFNITLSQLGGLTAFHSHQLGNFRDLFLNGEMKRLDSSFPPFFWFHLKHRCFKEVVSL